LARAFASMSAVNRRNTSSNRESRKQIGDPISDPEAMLGGRAGDRAYQLIEERTAFDKRGSCVGCGAHCHGKVFATQ
jgi:hypothetical protein